MTPADPADDDEIVAIFLDRVAEDHDYTRVGDHVYRLERRQGRELSPKPLLHLHPTEFGEHIRAIMDTEPAHGDVFSATALVGLHLTEDMTSSSRANQLSALGVRRRADGTVEWFGTRVGAATATSLVRPRLPEM